MQALLIQVGDVGPGQMKQALTAAQDLAVGLDVDLKTAALLVGKAFAGDTATLKRYGIVLDKTELKQRGVAVVLEAIQSKFGGQAAAKAQTFTGIIEQLGNTWGDLKEKIGQWLAQSSGMLTPMLAKISGAVTWLNDNFEEIKPVLAAVAAALAVGLVVGLGALGAVIYATVIPALTTMNIAMSANPIGIVVIALAAVAYAWVKWGDEIKDFLRAVWAKFLGNISTGLKVISKFFGIFNSEISDALESASDSLRETADEMAMRRRRRRNSLENRKRDGEICGQARYITGQGSKICGEARQSTGQGGEGGGESCRGYEEGGCSRPGPQRLVDRSEDNERPIPEGVQETHSRAEEKRPHHGQGARQISFHAESPRPVQRRIRAAMANDRAPESCACGSTERDRKTRGSS